MIENLQQLLVVFAAYPNIEAWLSRVQVLPHWSEVSAALDGFAASLEGKQFVAA